MGTAAPDTLIFGIVLAVFTFWLFAQSTLNIAPTSSRRGRRIRRIPRASGTSPIRRRGQSHVDNLGFAPAQMRVIDVTTALHTGTFIYRYTPTQSKFRLKCRLPHTASASVAVELKSLELVLR